MRYLAIFCLLAIFAGCPSPIDGDRTREMWKAEASLRRDASESRRAERFKKNLVNAYKYFSDGLNEKNFMKLEQAGKSLTGEVIPQDLQESLGEKHTELSNTIDHLGTTLITFSSTYLQAQRDQVRKAAEEKNMVDAEDLMPKINEIKDEFKKLDDAFDLGLKF